METAGAPSWRSSSPREFSLPTCHLTFGHRLSAPRPPKFSYAGILAEFLQGAYEGGQETQEGEGEKGEGEEREGDETRTKDGGH